MAGPDSVKIAVPQVQDFNAAPLRQLTGSGPIRQADIPAATFSRLSAGYK